MLLQCVTAIAIASPCCTRVLVYIWLLLDPFLSISYEPLVYLLPQHEFFQYFVHRPNIALKLDIVSGIVLKKGEPPVKVTTGSRVHFSST